MVTLNLTYVATMAVIEIISRPPKGLAYFDYASILVRLS